MKKISLFILCLLISRQAQAGSVEFSTYYPAPFAIYDRLKLNAHAAALPTPCNPGTLYLQAPGNLHLCDENLAWQALSSDTVWIKSALLDIYLTDTDPNVFVGIGTETPDFKLSLAQDGGILAKGTFVPGSVLNILPGPGGILNPDAWFIWSPKKAVVRIGSVTGAQWTAVNIGDYSTVTGGLDNTASGDYSTVTGGITNTASATHATVTGGATNIASGDYSTVSGGGTNQATGHYSVVTGGEGNLAEGEYSLVSGGWGNRATGDFSVISGGWLNQAQGIYSIISGGYSNTATIDYATITGGEFNTANGTHTVISGGKSNTAIGNFSVISGGETNTTSGDFSVVSGGTDNDAAGAHAAVSGGSSNLAGGDSSTISGGSENRANGHTSAASGRLNHAGGDYSWAGGRQMQLGPDADRTFVWGHNFTATPTTIDTPDAFIIYTGNVGIKTTTPAAKLDIFGTLRADLTSPLPIGAVPVNYNTGSIGLDLAERFETAEEVEVGDIVVLDETGNHQHQKSRTPYDPKVIGVVSAAPAILFQGSDLEIAPVPGGFTKGTNPPLALAGRVLCKVTTENGPIEPGDLLTSSSTPGHAMKALDPEKSHGAIIGKALESFQGTDENTTGTVLILVM